jgi:hypothetical protein
MAKDFMNNRLLAYLELPGNLFDRIRSLFDLGNEAAAPEMKKPGLFQRRGS